MDSCVFLLLNFLKNCFRFWAFELEAGSDTSGFDCNSTSTLMRVEVTLSDDGFSHLFEVCFSISVIFYGSLPIFSYILIIILLFLQLLLLLRRFFTVRCVWKSVKSRTL